MYEQSTIHPGVAELWRKQAEELSPEMKAYLDHAVEVAKEYFPSADEKANQVLDDDGGRPLGDGEAL